MDRIVKITKVKNVNMKNKHRNYIYNPSSILKVYLESGEVHVIDLEAEADITGVDYMEVLYPKKYKEKVIFSDFRSKNL